MDIYKFIEGYRLNKYPLKPPLNTEIYFTDDAISIPIYREGRNQVELYVLYNPLDIEEHAHPGLTISVEFLDDTKDGWSGHYNLLLSGESHGPRNQIDHESKKNVAFKNLMLVYSVWPSSVTPFTVAAVWKGKTAGPKHESLIKRFFPRAYIKDGYADTSKEVI